MILKFEALLLFYLCNCAFLNGQTQYDQLDNLANFFSNSKCIEEPSEDFLSNFLAENNNADLIHENDEIIHRNYRKELNELAQFNHIELVYNVINEEGPQHEKLFNISVSLGDETYHGLGKSKKLAKESAAKLAIENTEFMKPALKIHEEDTTSPPTVLLNNFSARNGYKVDYYIVDPIAVSKRVLNLKKLKNKSVLTNSTFWKQEANIDQPPKSPFNVEVNVAGLSFYGKGHTIQAAKHDAASKAFKDIQEKKNSPCESDSTKCKEAKDKLKSPISSVYELGAKRRVTVEFKETGSRGPAHKPIFEFECILGNLRYTAEGGSKKEAKRNAAMKVLHDLDYLEDNLEMTDYDSGHKNSKKRKSFLEKSRETVGEVFNYFYPDKMEEDTNAHKSDSDLSDKKSSKKNKWSPKEKLLKTGTELNLEVKFHSSRDKNGKFFSIIDLNLNPKYICFGDGSNLPISQEYASLNALKLLHKLDVLENIKEEDLNIENFSFDNFIWLAKEDVSYQK